MSERKAFQLTIIPPLADNYRYAWGAVQLAPIAPTVQKERSGLLTRGGIQNQTGSASVKPCQLRAN